LPGKISVYVILFHSVQLLSSVAYQLDTVQWCFYTNCSWACKIRKSWSHMCSNVVSGKL